MFRKFKKWINFPIAFKLLLFKAVLLSFYYELVLKLKLFKPIKALHKQKPEEHDQQYPAITEEEQIELQYIAKAMKLLEKFAPWRPKCYNRAMTAKRLLASKNIDARLHIGFRKKEGEFDGHAWITYKGTIVTGYLKILDLFQELKPLHS